MTRWYYGVSGGIGMFDAFKAESKAFGELLGDTERSRFIVPKFQRGFSWEKEHVQHFWDDIRRFQKERESQSGPTKYFLGLIVTMPDKDKPQEITLILDGQQRLATATILLAVIRDAAKNLGTGDAQSFADDVQNHSIVKAGSRKFSLELGITDKFYFSETIQSYPPHNKEVKNSGNANIKRAKKLLADQVQEMLKRLSKKRALEQLRELSIVVKSDLTMARVPVSELRDAFRIFETLNDRGLRLSVPDLLLNYLMGEAPDDQHEDIRDNWTEVVDRIGKHSLSKFLRYAWVSEHGDEKRDLFTVIKEQLDSRKLSSLEFARHASMQCVKYMELKDASTKLGEAHSYVHTIVDDFDQGRAFPLLLAAHTRLEPADVRDVAKWLVIFIVRFSLITDSNPGAMENLFYSLAKDVHTFATKKTPIASSKIAKHVKKSLKAKSPSIVEVENKISEVYLKDAEAKYIVRKLASLAESGTGEIATGNVTLEHIFPKRAKIEDWPNIEELKPLLWHIGNLTMIRPSLGDALGNKGYAIKRPAYQNHSELKMTQELAHKFSQWNASAVKQHAESLADAVNRIWSFDNTSLV